VTGILPLRIALPTLATILFGPTGGILLDSEERKTLKNALTFEEKSLTLLH